MRHTIAAVDLALDTSPGILQTGVAVTLTAVPRRAAHATPHRVRKFYNDVPPRCVFSKARATSAQDGANRTCMRASHSQCAQCACDASRCAQSCDTNVPKDAAHSCPHLAASKTRSYRSKCPPHVLLYFACLQARLIDRLSMHWACQSSMRKCALITNSDHHGPHPRERLLAFCYPRCSHTDVSSLKAKY